MTEPPAPTRGISKDISMDEVPESLGDNAYEVIIPPDSLPGDILRVTAGGKDYKITVPEGAEPGMALVFEGSKKKPAPPAADAPPPSEPDGTGDTRSAPLRRKSSLSLMTPRGDNGLIRATVAAAKNVGRQLSFQRRRKPVSSVPAEAVRITKAQPVEAEVVAVGDKLPAELSPALPDQFSKVELKDKTYWKFVIPTGWVEGGGRRTPRTRRTPQTPCKTCRARSSRASSVRRRGAREAEGRRRSRRRSGSRARAFAPAWQWT